MARMINFRDGARGYLFQGRFSSCPVSTDQYLVASLRYILRNPVKAKLVKQPWDYPWSSASYHCGIETDDILSQDDDLLSVVEDLKKLLSVDDERSQLLEEKNRTGRPFGPDAFYDEVKQITGIDARPKQPGRPTKNGNVSTEYRKVLLVYLAWPFYLDCRRKIVPLTIITDIVIILAMIRSFKNKGTEDIFDGISSKSARKICPQSIWVVANRKLDQINRVQDVTELQIPPGNRLEQLQGDRENQFSIRINQQYRVCFIWEEGHAYEVEITDYH